MPLTSRPRCFAGAWDRLDQRHAADFLLQGLLRTPDPLAFTGAVEAIFGHPAIIAALGDGLNDALLTRAASRADPRQAHIAVDALDGALRLTLSGAARPFRLLELLASVTLEETSAFAEAAARRLGVIYLHMPDASARIAARQALRVLADHHDARADALHELGALSLVDALESDTAQDVEAALRAARRSFSAATEADEERTDARLYAAALDGILALIDQRPASEVQAAAAEVHELALVRAAWRARGRLNVWLGDTNAAEQEWWTVTAAFAAAAHALDEDVWMNAAGSLEAIARAHRAARVAQVLPGSAPGLRAVIEPRISETFIAANYRLRLLNRWADDVRDHPELADAAAGLQAVVNAPKGDGAGLIDELRAKAGDPGKVDAIIASLSAHQQAILRAPGLETFDGQESVLLNPAERRVSQDIRAGLEGSPDYCGPTRIFFDRILDLTIRFVQLRQDIETGRPGGRFYYLTQPNALEREIHLDYYEFLKGTSLGAVVDIESSHVGGGRTDISFRYGGTRIVAEIKRDKDPAKPGQLDRYLNQAGLYQSSNVALGLLIVLDLSPKPQGQVRSLGHSIWLAEKPALSAGDERRSIVTALIAGNRPSPSHVK